ncbi:MAG: sigma-54-dependent Fis family transcriptional regulator [Fidelibacterota bacterium]|nr:MAG: sigma-54-dependent Fis family transcriptional regulator [Candidatus Neomarinimicrobiota bacterium]
MRIAIIDDDQDIINWLKHHLDQKGYEIIAALDGRKGLDLILENEPDVSLVDLKMPSMDGLEVIKQVLETYPQALVVMMTAHASIQTAVEAMKLGAFDYLTKPLHMEEVLMMLAKCREKISLLKENRLLKVQVEQMSRGDIYITQNENIQRLLDQAGNVAATDSTVLITGESGTGKEVFAKYIHKNSQRAGKQFVVVNCAALSEQLLESELFGHVKGSFTGAYTDHAGYFEVADGGTIFLDEAGELSPTMQVKLLRVLQEKEFSRVGETKARRTDVRIIAATNRDLQQLMAEGKIREDFYYRINVFEFLLLPLRERPEDIMFYYERFIEEYAIQMNKTISGIDPNVRDLLLSYDWPGNIRELKNVAERTSILCNPATGIISSDLIPDRLAWSVGGEAPYQNDDFKQAKEILVKEFEVNFITQHLRQHNGNIAATARKIGVHPVFLRQKIAILGIDAKHIKDESAKA